MSNCIYYPTLSLYTKNKVFVVVRLHCELCFFKAVFYWNTVSKYIFHGYYSIKLYLPRLLLYQTVSSTITTVSNLSSTVTTVSNCIFHYYCSIKLYLPRLLQSISLIVSPSVGKCNVLKQYEFVVSCIMLSTLERETIAQSSVVSDKIGCQCAWENFYVEQRAFNCNMLPTVRHGKMWPSSL
jgi:hypothetical protein